MARCPKCKKEINELDYQLDYTEEGTFSKDASYDRSFLTGPADYDRHFFCPKCYRLLFKTHEEAEEFLNRGV